MRSVIEHHIVIDQLGLFGPEDDQILMRGAVEAVNHQRAVAFIYESRSFWGAEQAAAAIVPADVARELIREGRLGSPPLASLTVLARDVRAEENDAGGLHPA